MAKSFDEILKRNDYKRLTSQLEDRAEGIAARIRKKLIELDDEDKIITIKTEGEYPVSVSVRSVRSRSCGSYTFLAMDCGMWMDNDSDCYTGNWASLEDIANSYYYTGDFGAWVEGAPRNAALAFLNAAGRIIERLGEMEDNKVKAVNAALESTENI